MLGAGFVEVERTLPNKVVLGTRITPMPARWTGAINPLTLLAACPTAGRSEDTLIHRRLTARRNRRHSIQSP